MKAARAKARNLYGDFTGGRLDFYASVASVYSMVKAFPMSLPSVIILCPKEFKFTDATASIETPHLAGVANLQTVWLDFGAPLPDTVLDCHALILWHGPQVNAEAIARMKNCRAIIRNGVGFDTVDCAAAARAGIAVCNVPDYGTEEVADHAMTLILASWRRLVVQDQMVRKGEWAKARPMLYQFPRLMGMTLGFISFGHVARAVARRAAPFGFQMLAYDPYIEELVMSDYGVQPVSYGELLERSDIVSMHAPGTKDAHHLMKEQHFRKMKKTALFVNTGRGSTVDEPAMIKALQEGWIAGAGLDVLETEPVGHNNPLLGMDNVILTAHVASASSRSVPPPSARMRAPPHAGHRVSGSAALPHP